MPSADTNPIPKPTPTPQHTAGTRQQCQGDPAAAFVWPPTRPPFQPAPTDSQQPPELSRRRVMGWLTGTAAAGAALVVAGPVAALETPSEDAELMAACAAFEEADRHVETSNALENVSQADWARLVDGPGIAWQDTLERLNDCPAPRTPEALQRKAQAALMALQRFHAEIVPGEIALALDCLADVAGRTGA